MRILSGLGRAVLHWAGSVVQVQVIDTKHRLLNLKISQRDDMETDTVGTTSDLRGELWNESSFERGTIQTCPWRAQSRWLGSSDQMFQSSWPRYQILRVMAKVP